VQPDIPYDTRLEDITGHNRGWAKQVDEALFGARTARRAATAPAVAARANPPGG